MRRSGACEVPGTCLSRLAHTSAMSTEGVERHAFLTSLILQPRDFLRAWEGIWRVCFQRINPLLSLLMRGLGSFPSLRGELFEVINLRERNGVEQKETKRRSQGSRGSLDRHHHSELFGAESTCPQEARGSGSGWSGRTARGKAGRS